MINVGLTGRILEGPMQPPLFLLKKIDADAAFVLLPCKSAKANWPSRPTTHGELGACHL